MERDSVANVAVMEGQRAIPALPPAITARLPSVTARGGLWGR